MSVFEGHREFGTGKIPGHAEGEVGMGTEGPASGSEASTVGGGRRPIDPLRWWALKRPPHYEADDPLDTHTNSHYHTSHRHTNTPAARCHGPGTPREPARGPTRPECHEAAARSPPGTSPAAAASINSPAPVTTPRGAVAPVRTPLAGPRGRSHSRLRPDLWRHFACM